VDQIFAYIYTLTRDRELAEDVTAATFAKGFEELPRFEWRGVPYSSWLYRVASNLVARQRRRPAWIELSPGLASDDESPLDVVEKRDRAETVRDAVRALPTDQRQAVVLRFAGEMHNREIAEIMGRSEGAVKLLTFRALITLRKRFGAPLPDGSARRGAGSRGGRRPARGSGRRGGQGGAPSSPAFASRRQQPALLPPDLAEDRA
jgi:RNA polymerase sigma-70 factor (ECF subfamily)